MRPHQLFVLLFITSIGSSHAYTFPTSLPDNSNSELNQIHRIAIVDEDGRMTEEQYAAAKKVSLTEVQNRFAATGRLDCPTSTSSASLVGDNKTVAASGHAFVNQKTCARLNTPTSCKFIVRIGSVERSFRIESMLDTGFKCPQLPEARMDWAVLKLDRPVDGVTPYELPERLETVEYADEVTAVGYPSDFERRDPRTNKSMFRKAIEDCEGRRISRAYGVPSMYRTNCDSWPGNSGGSLLRIPGAYSNPAGIKPRKSEVSGRDVLMAITRGSDETPEMRARAIKTGKPNKAPFKGEPGDQKSDDWATYYVPVKGDFAKAIRRAIGRSDPSQE